MVNSAVLTQEKSQNNILFYNLEKIQDKLDIIKKAILTFVPAEKIYLFGSYAYGHPTENSDIDIYVVVPDDFGETIIRTTGKIIGFLRENSICNVDLFLVYENRYRFYLEYNPFEQDVSNKGLLLYGNQKSR